MSSGLTPGEDASSDRKRRRSITKAGSAAAPHRTRTRSVGGIPGKAEVLVDGTLGPQLVTQNQPRFDYEGT